MRVLTMWYVQPAKPLISLRICAVWSEPVLVAWIFYNVKLLNEHHLEFLSLKGSYIGLSESTLVKMPHCWKSHVTAQMVMIIPMQLLLLTIHCLCHYMYQETPHEHETSGQDARKHVFRVCNHSKTCLKRPLSKRVQLVFKTNYRLMQVKSIAAFFRPSLSYHMPLRSLFCLFLSGRKDRFYCIYCSDLLATASETS